MIQPAASIEMKVKELSSATNEDSREISTEQIERKRKTETGDPAEKFQKAIEVSEKIDGSELHQRNTVSAVSLIDSTRETNLEPSDTKDITEKKVAESSQPKAKEQADLMSTISDKLSVYTNPQNVKPSQDSASKIQEMVSSNEPKASKQISRPQQVEETRIPEEVTIDPESKIKEKMEAKESMDSADKLAQDIQKDASGSMQAHSNITPQEVLALLK